jgi:RNA polymerase sigma factor (sigma-70 family)
LGSELAVTSVVATIDSLTPALVERARSGDRAAFEALLSGRVVRLMRLATSILLHDADAGDAVQDSCVRAWVELPQLRDPAQFDAWLWRIVINACRTTLRRRHRTAVREIAMDDATGPADMQEPGPGIGENVSEVEAIRLSFARLDPDRRAILILHHVEGRSVGEIAAVLGIPEGTAKWRLHAARQELGRALKVERR